MNLLALLGRGRQRERELDEEIRAHISMAVRERIGEGEDPAEAETNARREFGNETTVKEVTRGMWGWRGLETLAQDLRYGLRQLRRAPGFAAVAIITLALGIGANTAIFSVVDAVILRPLPYANPSQLVFVSEANAKQGVSGAGLSYQDFKECRKQKPIFSEMAGFGAHDLTLTGAGQPTVVHTVEVTPELINLLGAKPLAGRAFLAADGVRGAAPVVLVSENLWRSHFGAEPNLIGKSIDLDMRSFTVVGIMPANFRFPVRSKSEDVWIPIIQDPLFSTFMPREDFHWMATVARLRAGLSISQARAAMKTLSSRLQRTFPNDDSGYTVQLEPLRKAIMGDAKSPLLIMLGAVGLVLLIACANIANLLLARGSVRAPEISMRQALGAGRSRLVRQLLTESALLGILGGIGGAALAYFGVQSLKPLLPPGLPRAQSVNVDGWVLFFAFAVSAAASLIFGLVPALSATRSASNGSLSEGSFRSGESGGRRRARSVLVAAEIALAVVLLAGASLLIRSFAAMMSVNPGFNARRVVKAEISLPRYQYSTAQQWTAFANESLERIQAQPGLRDSGLAIPLPITDPSVNLGFDIPGHPAATRAAVRVADFAAVSPGYFHVMDIPLLRGRYFTPQDQPSTPRVAIITQAFADRYFPHQDPLGQSLTFGFPPNINVTREIVGVVGDIRDVALSRKPEPMMYVPFAQAPFWGEEVVVRSGLSTEAVAASIRRVVRGIDKNLPVTDVARLPDAMDSQASVAQPRFRTLLLSLFGALALALAAVGIFGVTSYSVARRTREIGIRLALGATPGGARRMVMAESAWLVLGGLAAGIPAALALTRFLSSLLYGVNSTDPLTFIAVPVVLAAVAILACYIPARRASKVDPMIALRYE